MKKEALLVCKSFLDRYPPPIQTELIQLLSESAQVDLQELPAPTPLEKKQLRYDPLEQIHYSWLSPYIRTLSENDIRLVLAALSEKQSKELQKQLGFGNHLPHLTLLSRRHLRRKLLEILTQNQELLPLAFLPASPLNKLMQMDADTFSHLVLFLGLHDLAFEMRQIIATDALKKIFSSLAKKEGEYLKTLLLHQEPLVFHRLFLTKWDGTQEHLRRLLEERGLHRLGTALYSAHPSLIWYVTHRLDMHQGTLLLKYKEKHTHARAEKILTDQIFHIITYLSSKESP